jgi:hypothetical protein
MVIMYFNKRRTHNCKMSGIFGIYNLGGEPAAEKYLLKMREKSAKKAPNTGGTDRIFSLTEISAWVAVRLLL